MFTYWSYFTTEGLTGERTRSTDALHCQLVSRWHKTLAVRDERLQSVAVQWDNSHTVHVDITGAWVSWTDTVEHSQDVNTRLLLHHGRRRLNTTLQCVTAEELTVGLLYREQYVELGRVSTPASTTTGWRHPTDQLNTQYLYKATRQKLNKT